MKRIFTYAVFLLLLPQIVFAQDAEKWGLPGSPTGKAGAALLDVLAGDKTTTEKFIDTHIHESLLKELSREDMLQFFAEVQQTLGEIELLGAEKASPYSVNLLIKSGGQNYQIFYDLASAPPHQFTELQIDEAREGEKHFSSIAELEKYLQKITDAGEFSGAVLVAKDGKPLLRKAYGLASKRFNVPNTVETKFNLGSINKEFTANVITQLVNEGKVKLDDAISTYLPDFPKEKADKITVRHLMRHRSGLGHYWQEGQEMGWANLLTMAELMTVIQEQPLSFEPGESQQYSNSGYVVLGAIIEKVTGQDYYDAVRERVYKVAGMENTDSYSMDEPVPNLAIGYTNQIMLPNGKQAENFSRNNLFIHSIKGSPAGGGYSTIDDLLKYDLAMKAGIFFKKYPNGAARSVSNSSGFGIAGGGPGISAILESDWTLGYTVVVISNYDPPTGEELGLEIMEMLREKRPMGSR